MEIGKKFNTLSLEEYLFYIDNHKKYSDFNTLGLYRSISENDKLNLEEKIQVRDYAHKLFRKSFDFLQLKDPVTFMEVQYLGEQLTVGDRNGIWEDLKIAQQKILADKKIKHRNFGTYSKHNCGRDNCIWNGVMVRQGSPSVWTTIHFDCDKNKWSGKLKSEKRKIDRKSEKQIINSEINL